MILGVRFFDWRDDADAHGAAVYNWSMTALAAREERVIVASLGGGADSYKLRGFRAPASDFY
jgi:hypothetical protein